MGVAVLAVLALLVFLLARSCTSGEQQGAPPATEPPATEPPPTTAAPYVPTWPLTGHLADPAQRFRPAVAVKVDNSPQGRPHAGLNLADLVYELQVESITRFIEVYHSQFPDRVGPVRSARSSDIDLLFQLGRPLLVWSGGNPGVTGQVRAAQDAGGLLDMGVSSPAGGHYWRDGSRSAPHNLYANPRGIHDDHGQAPEGWPGEILLHAPPDHVPAGATPVPGVRIDFGSVRVEYVWDGERKGWDRFQVDQRHPLGRSAFVDEGGVQVAPENVVVLFLDYHPDPVDARSPRAQSVGEGGGVVLTNGTSLAVRWQRPTNRDPWNLTHPFTGEPVRLAAGRVWVALVPAGRGGVAHLDPAEAHGLLASRV